MISASFQPTQPIHATLKLSRRDFFLRHEINPFRAYDEESGEMYCPLIEYHFKALMLVRFLEVWGRINTDLLQRGYNCTPRLRQSFARLISLLQREGRLIKSGDAFTAAHFSALYPHIPRLPTRGRWRIWEIAWGFEEME